MTRQGYAYYNYSSRRKEKGTERGGDNYCVIPDKAHNSTHLVRKNT